MVVIVREEANFTDLTETCTDAEDGEHDGEQQAQMKNNQDY